MDIIQNSKNKKIKKIGYTTGIFDLFHIGHLNLLIKAKQLCDYLIVGVTTDELCIKLKGKEPIIPFIERFRIIESIKYVDKVVAQDEINEIDDFYKYKFDYILKGSDWEGTTKWTNLEIEFDTLGVKVIYLPYTLNTSSTLIRQILETKVK